MISGPEKATSSINLFQDKMESEIMKRSPPMIAAALPVINAAQPIREMTVT